MIHISWTVSESVFGWILQVGTCPYDLLYPSLSLLLHLPSHWGC